MREYGVAESWTRLVDIVLGGGWGKILCTNESNALMVIGFGKLVLFTGQGRIALPIQGSKDSFHVENYAESLFFLNHKVGAVVGNDGVDDTASHEGGEAEVKQHHDTPPVKFIYSRRSRKN
ncbi:unnamed protein product [Fraxinus pennsylvanica]|uniref:Uncharacterized protein n=1 Tax=Fraxinus pennsylvanica TaxID=56036 RepID=A0AAD2EC61_9LAMI|nr:unnamed protein product [Fraxinus pennsylvanica]